MDKENIKERATIFAKYNKSIFVRTTNGNFYFCNIIECGIDFLKIDNFAGKRKGEKDDLLWMDIEEIQEYREMGANC